MDRNAKLMLGMSVTLIVMLMAAMGQAYGLANEIRLRAAEDSGKIAVLGEKVTALEKSQDAFRNDVRGELVELKNEVKEIAKRIP